MSRPAREGKEWNPLVEKWWPPEENRKAGWDPNNPSPEAIALLTVINNARADTSGGGGSGGGSSDSGGGDFGGFDCGGDFGGFDCG